MSRVLSSMRTHQQGLSYGGLVRLLIGLSLVLALGAKLVPVYLDHRTVLSVTRSTLAEDDVASLSEARIRRQIAQGLRINGADDFDTQRIEIVRTGGQVEARIRYQERVPLIYNIDLMIRFDDRVQ